MVNRSRDARLTGTHEPGIARDDAAMRTDLSPPVSQRLGYEPPSIERYRCSREDRGDLVLTDPDDMLATGIEIEARPAGKKVKRLSLLSGGERSLAAIAFLVAIFKARPSPFYVMDEVEAALDDVNLSRLLAIFKELQETSQLIVITHQKRTMEIADALYGVTMRDGVTTVVSQRLAD